MRYLVFLWFLFLPSLLFSQTYVEFDNHVKWSRSIVENTYMPEGIDTLTLDTLTFTNTHFYRISNKGDTIGILLFDFGKRGYSGCSDVGIRLTGHWLKKYPGGQIAESGNFRCNQKVDEWLYFFPSGKLQKYENYFRTNVQDYPEYHGALNGLYKEYFENGNVKISGAYKMVEKYTPLLIFNAETYEDEEKCCEWMLSSIKYGDWTEYNAKGKIISRKNYHDQVNNKTIRDISDKLNEATFNIDWIIRNQ